ncbi:protein FAR1-RELATED SEQUENCE 5-like [Corylus avellana]|uniref:protein FAR1-RELATED SEQUENCE 5-like n=1 Tax=Corylus avellana TaxID=13451 RepID=UPI00286C8CE1|nr:protein FAR1-RELATED SEQUENCE 5-like [Corylus avellana]
MSEVQAFAIDLACASGISPKATHALMSREADGRANLGYTELDQKNYLRTRQQKNLIYDEAGCLLRYFQEQLAKNPSFQYAVQLDNEEQITNIFWVDARMIIDYAYFGDVITFDTTYGTNKELRPLAVFTGFNHHRGVVIFGAALLYDETAESFKWLFENFLDAHGGKKPQTIFTDQDVAMAKALTEVMPDTWHGLCTWHIMQNGIKHLGNLMKDGSHFLRDYKSCMFENEDEIEFENAWKKMIQTYNGGLVSWLDGIYKLKTKWAKCHMKNAFTLGVQSTQLNESLNRDLKAYLKSKLGILEFFQHFERVVEQKRHKELEAEYNARQKLPTLGLKNSPLLKHAAQMYTPVIFKKFHDEYDYASATIIKHRSESQSVHEYIVALYEKDKEYKVIFNRNNKIISCSCMKFETFGILCCHALKVFDLLDIKIIPDTYILKRWTREAKSGHIYIKTKNVEEDVNLNVTQRYRKLCPRVVKLVAEATDNDEAYAFVEGMLEGMEKHVQNIKNSSTTNNEVHMSLSNGNEIAIHTPFVENLLETIKGIKKKDGRKGGKRFRSWVENQSKKNTKITTKNNVGEKFFQEINCSLNIQDDNSNSHAKCYSRQQIEQVPYSVPMTTFEEPFGDRPETGFIEFLRVTDGFNLTPTLPADSANTNINLRNFLGH